MIEIEGDPPQRIEVRKRGGDERLEIAIDEVLLDVEHDMGEAASLEKDGVERDLQELLAAAPQWCGEGFRLVRREWPTDIGPVDLMCRDARRRLGRGRDQAGRHDRGGRAAQPLPRADPARPGDERLPRRARRAADQAAGGVLAAARGIACVEVDLAVLRGEREPELTLFSLRPRGADGAAISPGAAPQRSPGVLTGYGDSGDRRDRARCARCGSAPAAWAAG